MVRYREDATTFATVEEALAAYEAFLDGLLQVYRPSWERDQCQPVAGGVQVRAWGLRDPHWLQRVDA
jgi:hypothetical protein